MRVACADMQGVGSCFFSIIVIFGRSIFIVIIIIIVIILVITVMVVVVQRWCSRLAIPGHFLHAGGILEANE